MDMGTEIYRRFLNGDEEAFEELIVLYGKNLVYFINGYVHELAASEDLMEDTFLDLYVKRRRFDGTDATFKTYLFKIARHKAVYYLRFGKRFSAEPIDTVYDLADAEDVESAVLKEEKAKAIASALGKMKENYREVLFLAYLEDMSASEIGAVTGKSAKQVNNLVSRARLQLKKLLSEEDV